MPEPYRNLNSYDGYRPGPIELLLTAYLAVSVGSMYMEGRDSETVSRSWAKCSDAADVYASEHGIRPEYSDDCETVLSTYRTDVDKLTVVEEARRILDGEVPTLK